MSTTGSGRRATHAAKASTNTFALQFDATELPGLASRFGDPGDQNALAIGRNSRARGYYTRAEFVTVCRWKTPRSKPKVESNTAAAIRTATRRAFTTHDLEEQIGYLLELSGVGMPTASVLLHIAFPEAFPILDVRAVESLGVAHKSSYTPAFWADYVHACRELAAQHGVSLRTLDKALWEYSKERSQRELERGRRAEK